LLDLTYDLLPTAFERVIRETKLFPWVQGIRPTVALDNARQIEEVWQPQWQDLLRYIKRNIGNSSAFMPPLDAPEPLKRAIETIGAGDFRAGATWIGQHHFFMYGIENWTSAKSPRLAGERIEKRVRDLWESYR
jgi:hypothetical protein